MNSRTASSRLGKSFRSPLSNSNSSGVISDIKFSEPRTQNISSYLDSVSTGSDSDLVRGPTHKCLFATKPLCGHSRIYNDRKQTMTVLQETICPGCGLRMPARKTTTTSLGYYNVSDECWDLYTEVLGTEYSNAFLFGQVHQLTVDSYAVQHAGGPHPDKSVGVHLSG